MKIKLDECVDARLQVVLKEAGYDAVTVPQQELHGIDDQELARICSTEGLALVTLDIHFSNILRFDPKKSSELVVLRGPDDLLSTTRILVETLISGLAKEDPRGKLWVVEPGRIRIHESEETEPA